jgi:hypothetical protein
MLEKDMIYRNNELEFAKERMTGLKYALEKDYNNYRPLRKDPTGQVLIAIRCFKKCKMFKNAAS